MDQETQHSPFDEPEVVKASIEALQEKMAEPQNEFNKLHVRVFSTEDGKKLLEQYRTDLIDNPSFVPEMGFENGASLGFYREGQNSIIRQMCIRLKKGLEIL